MALFKISKGKSENLPANKVDGYCYVTTNDGKFYVDYKKDDGTLDRFALNAVSADQWKTARNLNGMVVNGTSNVVNYGTCSTASDTAAKVVSCSNFALITGAEITVKFITTNTAANPTLNVNNTGAKAIYYRGSAIGTSYLATNRTYTFRYNGSQYDLVGDINTDTNTDTKVTQTVTTSDASYPLLLAPSGQTATKTTTSYFDSGVTLNPSTNTIAANISGNAASSTYTTQVRVTLTDPASATTYYPVWTSGTTSETNYDLLNNNGFRYVTLKGTADSTGYGTIILGNNVASGTAANKYGSIRMYGTKTSYIEYKPFNNASNYTRYLVGTSSSAQVGSATQPVYINSVGTITACTSYDDATVDTANKLGTATVGSGVKPIYLNAGTATASTSSVGSGTKPVYMSSGTITASSSTVGSSSLPVYMSSGTITKCSTTLGVSITGNAETATKATQDGNGDVISSTYLPLAGGTMTGTIITPADDSIVIRPAKNNCDRIGGKDSKFWKIYATTFHGDLSGNASTSTKLKTARTINSVSFDGTEDITFAGSYKTNTEPKSLPQGLSFIELPPTATSTGDPTYGTCLTVASSNTTRAFQLCVNNKPDVYVRAMHTNFTSTTVPGYSEWYQVWRKGNSVTGAVWNDYAECRESNCKDFGYVLMEVGDDSLTKTTERLSHFAGVSSDTWGFSQGETDKAKTPIAVAGRVLVYPYQDRNNYKPGDCVCAAPGGTVDIMTREEVREWPDRIVGTVSCVPDYEEWGGGEGADRAPVKVNGRIWIKVV